MPQCFRIIFADDEPDLVEALAEYFSDLGHEAEVASDGFALEAALRARPADLVILDLNLPGRSGFDLLRDPDLIGDTPVIILTGNQQALDRIVGLEMGADDYVTKPVDPRELAARAAAVLERRRGRPRSLVGFEVTCADLAAARVLIEGGRTELLSPGEVALIRAFAAHPHRVLSRDELIDLAPAGSSEALDRSVDTRVARLRRKLRTDRIVTVRGHGYRYEPPWTD
ncbi:response regulator transcription factor [Rubellimicrobium arenae]|uniref:response regulator transcription factor n=1 Tax=Rubellimicrobium arenae TaxID=2817372 RepID=UPI001B30F6B9|nr:response regulator transcription factor [Rubellimicrobium arenae]